MKINDFKTLVLVFTFLSVGLLSCNTQKKEHDHDHGDGQTHHHENDVKPDGLSFKDTNLEAAFDQYELLRIALTETNFNKSKSNALILQTVIEKVEGNETVLEATQAIANANDIDAQRLAFSDLTNGMTALIKGNLSSGELYLAHCPMALDNTGAYWITQVNEIKNPYFGDMMLKCGTVKETLN
ncbi:DUF3347 domain-containing protein [Reichenbachiella sp. MALMAid0571]|uniref:DUF3347 domain-containing protein n=1 Tax=Reichenbachiella sp. MALMAid0571 TaxID=3143939 RepID=UPI0032DE2DC6